MRGGAGWAFLYLAVYPLVAALLPVVASTAYAGAVSNRSVPAKQQTAAVVSPPPVPGSDAVATIAQTEVTVVPVPPIATVSGPSALDQLQADLRSIAARSGGRVGITLQELSGPQRTRLSIGGNQTFVAASSYKLPLLMAEAHQIAAGQIHAGDVLCYDPSDAEDGYFTDYWIGRCLTRQELAVRTGRFSDNTAAHILVRYLGGGAALNAYARSIEMTGSALWDPNTTTTDDLANAWVNEVLGRLGGNAAQQWLYPLLTHTAYERGIPAGVPAGVTVIHKIGTVDGTRNDSALVTNGRVTYVLSVAIDGPDEATGWRVIAQISSRIWQYEASRRDFVAPIIASPAPPLWPDRRH
jgi:beta-lactamase class A